jgi:hypothetical protein
MTDHLAIALRDYLERSNRSALDVERTAGLPNATIARIFTGRHPRSDTMSALLAAVPIEVARTFLIAYLKDDCPDDWEGKVLIDVLLDDSGIHERNATSYTAGQPTDRQTLLEQALSALTHAANGDAATRDWIIDTAKLLNLIP